MSVSTDHPPFGNGVAATVGLGASSVLAPGLGRAAGTCAAHGAPDEVITIIEAEAINRNYWREVWHYRDLLAILAWRDIAVRYKQTALGIAWALVRPLTTMLVLTFVFGTLAKLPSDGGVPYPLLVLAGMLAWSLASGVLGDASISLVGNAALIGKVYFPRIVIPAATVAVAVIDFAITLAMMLAAMIALGHWPGPRLALLPFMALLGVAAGLGPALLLAALTAAYRDFRHLVPFALQIGLYASPVGFSSAVVPADWRLAYALNPMTGVIDGFRWCLFGSSLDLACFLVSSTVAALLLGLGVRTFRQAELQLADVI